MLEQEAAHQEQDREEHLGQQNQGQVAEALHQVVGAAGHGLDQQQAPGPGLPLLLPGQVA